MSIKRGINKGDLVYISAISKDDILYPYGGKRALGSYVSEQAYKCSTLTGMVGKLVDWREPEGKNNKSGYTKAIIRLTLPENFFEFPEEKITYWDRFYDVNNKENTNIKTKSFEILFSTGVKLELISMLPSDLRYGASKHELVYRHVREPSMSIKDFSSSSTESDFTPENFSE